MFIKLHEMSEYDSPSPMPFKIRKGCNKTGPGRRKQTIKMANGRQKVITHGR